MYNDKICDHFMNPRNSGVFENAKYVVEIGNPICGDTVHIYLKVESNIVKDVRFQAYGCTGSIATASIMTELIKNSTFEEIKKYDKGDVINLLGELEPAQQHCIDIGLNILNYCSEPWNHLRQETEYLVEEGEVNG